MASTGENNIPLTSMTLLLTTPSGPVQLLASVRVRVYYFLLVSRFLT